MNVSRAVLAFCVCCMISPSTWAIQNIDQPPVRPQRPHPLRVVAVNMARVADELNQGETGDPVQQRQEEIVRQLDEMIERLEESCSSCSACSGGGRGGGRPLADSMIIGGPGGVGELLAPRKGRHQLDKLPSKIREQILQSQKEGFPPGYEEILQEYYRRLAEQRAVEEAELAQPEETDKESQ